MKFIADDGDKRGFAGDGKECQSLLPCDTRFDEVQDEQKLFLRAFASGTMAQTTMSRHNPFRKSIKVALRLRLPEAW